MLKIRIDSEIVYAMRMKLDHLKINLENPEDKSVTPANKTLRKVRQSYKLTTAKHDLNKHQFRIFLRMIEKLQPNMAKEPQISLFQQNFEIDLKTVTLLPDKSKNYTYMKEALEGLRMKSLSVRGKDDAGAYTRYTGFITAYNFYDNNHKVRLEIDKEVLPLYLELKAGFTQFNLDVAFNLDSVYTMKFYQLICHWKDVPYIRRSVMDLKEWLGLTELKGDIDKFKRVLNNAMEELKEKGDIYFTYKEEREKSETGREKKKVIGFVIFIHSKQKEVAQADQAKSLLKIHFDFKEENFQEIEYIFHDLSLVHELSHFLIKLHEEMDRVNANITNRVNYTLAAIKNHFKAL